MKKPMLFMLVVFGFGSGQINAQKTVCATGGDAVDNSGSVSFTVGQIDYLADSGPNGTAYQGVQQPYEISLVLGNGGAGREIEAYIFPNPTANDLVLAIDELPSTETRFKLLDANGRLLLESSILETRTLVPLDKMAAGVYFLSVWGPESELKSFKIIKN